MICHAIQYRGWCREKNTCTETLEHNSFKILNRNNVIHVILFIIFCIQLCIKSHCQIVILVKFSNRTLFHSLKKSNQEWYKFLYLNVDLSLNTLYFYCKSVEWVIKIIRLWPDFSEVAKHDFKEFSWWKGILLAGSYRPYMFSIRQITK